MSDHVRERLGAYLDGELAPVERSQVSQHLAACADCRRLLDEMVAVDDAARSLPVEAPEGYFDTFASRLRGRLHASQPRRGFRPPVWSLAAAAALLLAVITPLTLKELPEAASEGPARREQPREPPPVAEQPEPGAAKARKAEDVAAVQAAPTPPPAKRAYEEVEKKEARPRQDADRMLRDELDRVARPTAPPASAPASRHTTVAADAGAAEEPAAVGGAASADARRPEEEGRARRAMKDEPRQYAAAPPAPPPAGTPAVIPEAVAVRSAEPSPAPSASGPALASGASQERAKTDVLVQRVPKAMSGPAAAGEARYRYLRARTASTAAEARALREAWRAFAASPLAGPHADEARVAAIEAAVQAYRFSGEARDYETAEADAKAYLARPEAQQADRVKALIAGLEP